MPEIIARPARHTAGAPESLILLGVPLAVIVFLLGLEATDVDRIVENWFFDAAAGSFPLQRDTVLEVVLHYWTRCIVALIAAIAFAGFLLSFTIAALARERRMLLFVAVSIALSTAAVAALKLTSGKHCPWDLEEYGGLVPYTRLLELAPPGEKPGHCFPAGHASTGFSLLAFYFVGRARRDPRLARAGLALGLGAGLVLGVGRMAQGAHFLTHVLWAGVVCWLVTVAVYAAIMRAGASTSPCGQGPGAMTASGSWGEET